MRVYHTSILLYSDFKDAVVFFQKFRSINCHTHLEHARCRSIIWYLSTQDLHRTRVLSWAFCYTLKDITTLAIPLQNNNILQQLVCVEWVRTHEPSPSGETIKSSIIVRCNIPQRKLYTHENSTDINVKYTLVYDIIINAPLFKSSTVPELPDQ